MIRREFWAILSGTSNFPHERFAGARPRRPNKARARYPQSIETWANRIWARQHLAAQHARRLRGESQLFIQPRISIAASLVSPVHQVSKLDGRIPYESESDEVPSSRRDSTAFNLAFGSFARAGRWRHALRQDHRHVRHSRS